VWPEPARASRPAWDRTTRAQLLVQFRLRRCRGPVKHRAARPQAERMACRTPGPSRVAQAQLARPPAAPLRSGETIEATGGHPFWVISGEDLDKRPVPEHCPAEVPNATIPGRWVNAIDLRVGDGLFTRDGRRVPVTNVSVRHARMKVYNLQVAELENYAVGQTGILVHNTSGSPTPSVSRVGTPRPGVTEVPLADLNPLHPVPRPNKPPNHIPDLANTIRTNGYDLSRAIPVARMPDGRLVQLGGHHRAAAMGHLGETTIPARVVDWNSLPPKTQNWWRQRFPNFPWDDFLR
jgi:hypothetical protein